MNGFVNYFYLMFEILDIRFQTLDVRRCIH